MQTNRLFDSNRKTVTRHRIGKKYLQLAHWMKRLNALKHFYINRKPRLAVFVKQVVR